MSAAVNSSEATVATTSATVNNNVSASLTAADSTSSQSMQTLGLVHQARLAQLTRTAAIIEAQYGATSKQAIAAQAAVTTSKVTVARLAVVNHQVVATAPQVAAKGWALYGHIYNSQLQPATAYTVFLVDEQNAYQSAFGFAYTGSDGSFHINYQGSANESAAVKLFLEIANNKAQPVYLSTTAFVPKIGAATYQDVTLPSGEPVIGDPPAEIRAIAMPDIGQAATSTSQDKDKPKKP
jgi:hypothetical protein